MKKKLIGRGLLGFPVGIAIGYVITVIISICIGDGFFHPVNPELVNKMGSELNAILIQTGLSGIMGTGFAMASVIWEIDSWSLAKQSGFICNCLRDYVPHLLFCQLDAPFDRWNSVLCRYIRSDLPRCLGNSVFCVEKEDSKNERRH